MSSDPWLTFQLLWQEWGCPSIRFCTGSCSNMLIQKGINELSRWNSRELCFTLCQSLYTVSALYWIKTCLWCTLCIMHIQVYCITKELSGGRKSFNGSVINVNGRLLIQNDEQLRCWRQHFTSVCNPIIFGELLPWMKCPVVTYRFKLLDLTVPL